MSDYKRQPRYNSKVRLLTGAYAKVNGVNKKTFTETEIEFLVSRKSYGGTETTKNGQVVIEDTFVIECAYRSDISSMDALKFLSDNSVFEILNRPEDVNDQHRVMTFKVRRFVGGV